VKYVSIDVETTGIDPIKNQVIEIGAIIEDTSKKLTYDELPKFKCIIEHEVYNGSAFAINLNQRIFSILSGIPKFKPDDYRKQFNILTPDIARNSFIDFLMQNGMNNRFIAAGKNYAGFDYPFLKSMHPEWPQSYQRVLDPGPMYTNFTTDAFPPDLETCKQRAGLSNTKVSHDALEDAWDVIQVLRAKY
jgi:DNA polymerase III epsilon subunit-like protein